MTFPHYFHLFGRAIHPHLLMELFAYTGGFQIYLRIKKRWPRAAVGVEQNLWIIVGAIFGALFGSKILAWLESAPDYWAHRFDPQILMGGKTIVGGLLGGWFGVEIAKKIQNIRHATGDAFVFPLIYGMAVGRIGCFLTGVSDHTCGNRSDLPWAIDMGDGIRRHPTQLYDIVFLCLLAILLGLYSMWREERPVGPGLGSRRERASATVRVLTAPPTSGASLAFVPGVHQGGKPPELHARPSVRRPLPNGRLFRLFLLGYLLWRFGVEFIKPRYTYAGLSAIQMACAAGAIAILVLLEKNRRTARRSIETLASTGNA